MQRVKVYANDDISMGSMLLIELELAMLTRCRMSVGYAKTEHCPVIPITRATLAAG